MISHQKPSARTGFPRPPITDLSLPSQASFSFLRSFLYTRSSANLPMVVLLPPLLLAAIMLPTSASTGRCRTNHASIACRRARIQGLRENITRLLVVDTMLQGTQLLLARGAATEDGSRLSGTHLGILQPLASTCSWPSTGYRFVHSVAPDKILSCLP
jgi:hypothetical protein